MKKQETISRDIIWEEVDLSGRGKDLTGDEFEDMVDYVTAEVNEWAFNNAVLEAVEEYMAGKRRVDLDAMVRARQDSINREIASFQAGLNRREGWPL